ncbi:MAG TPA: hypothetical protein VK848_06735, partial [Acidimicrobiia bacterium]|nr:hypothetical protein [Acidimicrobiia bacterium]
MGQRGLDECRVAARVVPQPGHGVDPGFIACLRVDEDPARPDRLHQAGVGRGHHRDAVGLGLGDDAGSVVEPMGSEEQ